MQLLVVMMIFWLAPISQMTTGNFYQSSIQIDQALTGAYSDLNPLYDNMMRYGGEIILLRLKDMQITWS